jgi:hypothetical protein
MISVRIRASPMIVLGETYSGYSDSVAGRSRSGGISNQLQVFNRLIPRASYRKGAMMCRV